MTNQQKSARAVVMSSGTGPGAPARSMAFQMRSDLPRRGAETPGSAPLPALLVTLEHGVELPVDIASEQAQEITRA